MPMFIAHRQDGTAYLLESRNPVAMRQCLAMSGYDVEEVPEETLKRARPELLMTEQVRRTPQARAIITAAAERYPSLVDVLAEITGRPTTMSIPQAPEPEGFDIVANMKARVEAAKTDKPRHTDEPEPAFDIVADMRARFELDE